MEIESIIANSKWEIIKELTKNPKSPMELANHFKTTVPNISQQLKILEAFGVVSKNRTPNSLKGKPRMKYFVSTDITLIFKISKNHASKQQLKKDSFSNFMLNTLIIPHKKDQFFLVKNYADHMDILADASIGYFKTTEKTIELFVITPKTDLARKKISNMEYQNSDGAAKKIISWSHNKNEIDEGLEKKDPHFVNLVKESLVLSDETGLLGKYKEQLNQN